MILKNQKKLFILISILLIVFLFSSTFIVIANNTNDKTVPFLEEASKNKNVYDGINMSFEAVEDNSQQKTETIKLKINTQRTELQNKINLKTINLIKDKTKMPKIKKGKPQVVTPDSQRNKINLTPITDENTRNQEYEIRVEKSIPITEIPKNQERLKIEDLN